MKLLNKMIFRKSSIILFFLNKKFFCRLSIASLLFTSFSCSNLALEENIQGILRSSTNIEEQSSQVSEASVEDTSQTSETKTEDTSQTPEKKIKKTSSEYVNLLLPEARRIEREYGIPLDLTIAIARQESGNGDYVIGQGNHFGLRCASDDCITLEKNGQQISYETCPDISECFDIFAESVKALTGDRKVTLRRLYRNGYATSPQWVRKVRTIRKEVRRTLSEANIKY
jgi:flagellum-specific peptidoglycan hydrolase FlgJ